MKVLIMAAVLVAGVAFGQDPQNITIYHAVMPDAE